MTRPSRSTVAALALAGAASIVAAYWRARAGWWSQADINEWVAVTETELATIEPEGFTAVTECIVVRAVAPESVTEPFYWHVVAVVDASGPAFERPFLSEGGWAASDAAGWAAASDAVDAAFTVPADADS